LIGNKVSAQNEPRESIQDLYAALLANAMDERFSEDVRPEFIDIVRELQPIDESVARRQPKIAEHNDDV
jgi:hypothetical protein